ncbi:MAG: MoaD/ThiS family protein [Gammaproteobacteria bacterium]|nr:MoaD/ThiS family protein [Gammaproteobacteria bacterium]
MQITFKLFATLMRFLPKEAKRNVVNLDVADMTTPNDLISQYNLPPKEVHLVLVNGVYLYESDRNKPLKNNDALAIWPPVAGG